MNTPSPVRYELPRTEDRAIWDIWLSMYRLPAMAAADEVGLFQSLSGAALTAEEIAGQLGRNRRAIQVLLSLLAALGLCVARGDRYELTELARAYLLPASPYYWGPLLRVLGVLPQQREALLRALAAENDIDSIVDRPVPSKAWDSGHVDRAQAELISRIMHCHSLPACIGAVKSGALDGVTRLLDVGGGSGCFSIAAAQHFPEVRCTVMELPGVCEVARSYIEAGGVADRVDAVPVNMFREEWPAGYDGILFSNVFHDWNAATNEFLACRAHAALRPGGRIFLHEMLMAQDGAGPLTTASFSMLMLFGTQGRQYSRRELEGVLASAGFVDLEVRNTYGYYSLVSGRKG